MTNKAHLLLLFGTEAALAPLGVCGHGRNKEDRTPLGSGVVGSQPWGVCWIHLGTLTKIPEPGPILREPSVIGLGAVGVLGLSYSLPPNMQRCRNTIQGRGNKP